MGKVTLLVVLNAHPWIDDNKAASIHKAGEYMQPWPSLMWRIFPSCIKTLRRLSSCPAPRA